MAQKRSENTYQKINTIFKRDERNIIMPFEEYSVPELNWLKDCKFDAEEKIDGTNIRIEVNRDGDVWKVEYKGKTDNAIIPKPLYKYLTETFTEDKVLAALGLTKQIEEDAPERYTLYGEGYGVGIQSGGYYRNDVAFIGFDVKVDNMYLLRENRDEIFTKLGADIVPYMGQMTINEAIEFVQKGFNSKIAQEEHLAEGLVLRSPIGIMTRRGERIVFKVKTCDFVKYKASLVNE